MIVSPCHFLFHYFLKITFSSVMISCCWLSLKKCTFKIFVLDQAIRTLILVRFVSRFLDQASCDFIPDITGSCSNFGPTFTNDRICHLCLFIEVWYLGGFQGSCVGFASSVYDVHFLRKTLHETLFRLGWSESSHM